jgi:hypothetical protein
MRRRFIHLSIVTQLALCAFACSSTTPSAPSGIPDASAPVDAAAEGGTSQCTTASVLAASVDAIAAAGEASPPAGGTVTDGTYVLTAARAYGGTEAPGAKITTVGAVTLVISGAATKYEQVKEVAPGTERASGTLKVAATSLTFTEGCRFPAAPGAPPDVFDFSASAGSLLTTFKDGATTIELDFTKQ